MDAIAQLALMTKAKLVFESQDTFLSFPALTPISYTPDQMNFTALESNEQMRVFSEFSNLTNALPQGTLYQPSLDNVLWDVYLGILQNAQLAQGSLTSQQLTELQAAQALLTVSGPDGLPVPSPTLVAYKQYQQVWFAASQNYNNQQVTASASSDPKVQTHWKDNGEPLARAQVQAAERDWEALGFKGKVEQAQQVEQTYVAQSPQLKWQSWTSLCNPTVDFLTDPTTNAPFGPTVFAPYNIFDHGSWPSFSISGSDIPNLLNQAPAELKNLFGTTSQNSTIDSLSFEYCSVALSRPWFQSDIFSERFWRLSDPTVQLCDGSAPPKGYWPAYIAAVVFARNIVVTSHETGAVRPQPLPSFPPLLLPGARVPPQPTPPVSVLLRPRITAAPQVTAAARTVGEPLAASPSLVTQLRPTMMERAEVVGSAVAQPAARPPATAVTLSPALRARLSATTFIKPVVQTPVPAPQPPAPPPSHTESSGTQISVLAFVCKRLPKCPNPDPSLKWS